MRRALPLPLLLLPLLLLGSAPAVAEPLWRATHTIAPGEILASGDVALTEDPHPRFGALPAAQSPVGLEAKRRIAFGRVVTERDVGRPSLVHANALVRAVWHAPGIEIEMQARALESGVAGDSVRLLNTMTSRTIVGVVLPDGSVAVEGAP